MWTGMRAAMASPPWRQLAARPSEGKTRSGGRAGTAFTLQSMGCGPHLLAAVPATSPSKAHCAIGEFFPHLMAYNCIAGVCGSSGS